MSHRTTKRGTGGKVWLPTCLCVLTLLGCGGADESSFIGRTNDPSNGMSVPATAPTATEPESPVDGNVAPVRPAITVTVGSFNVKEYFDTACDTRCCTSACPGRQFEQQPSDSEFEAKTNRVANAVVNLDTDILLLQEVESQSCVDALLATLGEGFYSVAIMGETGGTGSLDVVTLARDTFLEHRIHRPQELTLSDGRQSRFAREFLEVHLERDGQRIIVFNAHFKSKNNDDPARRLAEAERARAIMEARSQEFPSALIVLGGDLNDVPGSDTIAVFDETNLFSRVTTDLAPGLGTYYGFSGRSTILDHLIGVETSQAYYIRGSAQVLRNDPNSGLFGSDHAGLRASFGLGQ